MQSAMQSVCIYVYVQYMQMGSGFIRTISKSEFVLY